MKPLDIVVWGATGYTGRLVVQHLALQALPDLRWAIAGRDRGKLDSTRAALGADVDVVVADALDPASLRGVVERTRVVVSTVGPYAKYGTPLVEACVDRGVDYCDITGEPQWIRDNIDRLQLRAVESGARIVHCCGFDSIPSDLGVWMLHEHLRREHDRSLVAARFYVKKIKGGFSGGTTASILNVLEQAARDSRTRRVLGDPYALNPEGERNGPDRSDRRTPRYDRELGRWTAPFLMAGINTRIVRRSNALLGYPYGREFRYEEAVMARGPVQAWLVTLGLTAMTLGGAVAPTRRLIRRLAPGAGQGPSPAQRESGYFEITLLGWSDGDPALRVRGTVRGECDPGYGETSKMLAQSALCLACDDLAPRGGILTPAVCMGTKLTQRLRRAGMTFEASTSAENFDLQR